MGTPFDFPAVIYTLQKENLKNSLKYFLGKFRETMPSAFNTFLNDVGQEDVTSLRRDEGYLFNEELANYMKATLVVLKYIDSKGTPAEMVPPFSDLFLCTYRTIRIKSKPLADRWLRQAIRKHKRFLTTHGILAKLPSDINIAP